MSTCVEMTCAFRLGEVQSKKVLKGYCHILQHQNIVAVIIGISQRKVTRSIPNFGKMFGRLRERI